MILLTVGTQFSFERLVKAVDIAVEKSVITETIYAQIGNSTYRPRNFESVSFLEKYHFDKYLHKASYIIGHAGMGTIIMASVNDKPLLVMPRRRKYGEVVNDHQLAIAKKFEKSNHVLVAYHESQLPQKLEQLKTFVPRKRIAQPQAVVDHITSFLNQLSV